ncbi:MAG: DUF1326 domain-containing protein [Planctomycetota bacterium]
MHRSCSPLGLFSPLSRRYGARSLGVNRRPKPPRGLFILAFVAWAASGIVPDARAADSIRGIYLESRTCQVYTGPCFANAEVQLTGKEAIMAWGIEEGQHAGVDLTGLNVVLVLSGDATLGFKGVEDPRQIKSLVLVDERASDEQRAALVEFARLRAGRAGQEVVRVEALPITMKLDAGTMRGELSAGKIVKLATRKAKPSDCICTNEVAYYPPLAKLHQFAAGVSVESEFSGRGLGSRWSMPNSRSAYVGKFE